MPVRFPEDPSTYTKAKLIRRLLAIFYDSLLCIALLMATTGAYMGVAYAVIGAEEYKAITESGSTIGDPVLKSVLFITLYLFFGYFWTKTGQTLGMQVWHLRVQNPDNTSITWLQALMRFFMALLSSLALGLGYLWMLFDKKDRTWQCMFSDTEVVRIPKRN